MKRATALDCKVYGIDGLKIASHWCTESISGKCRLEVPLSLDISWHVQATRSTSNFGEQSIE